jgi:Myb-like DNA-binding protein FlbD
MKNAFTAEEDEIILKGERDGLSWPDIANQLPGRNSDQIRSRFLNTINPQLLKNVAWTAEEERILNKAQSELGNKWSIIASFLPGRSENDIKNHWHNRKLKAQRKLKSMAALSKRDKTLTDLRNGMCDIVLQNYETDFPLMDADTKKS